MRKEHISYAPNEPISVSYCSVKEYPIHWHDAIEIIFVLKGTINITIDAGVYKVFENEIEVVNINEAHSIYSNEEENEILIFHIDPNFLGKYYNDIENVFFYVDTSNEKAQENKEYMYFRTSLSKILYEIISRNEGYDEKIEDNLIDLLYYAINNFNYLTYDNEWLKENGEQFERYHRIEKYIFNNYNNKISLQEIAKKEFLSAHYLSHEIKNAIGYSFTDFLNLTRVEESIKLLLDTEMSISEISYEVGFSHIRYYNKNFKLYYKCTPLQYKKRYYLDEKNYNKSKQIKSLTLEESLKHLYSYLENYDRFKHKNKIQKIKINVEEENGEWFHNFKKVINVGDAFDLLVEDNKNNLRSLQQEIDFEYGRIFNVFYRDMGIFSGTKFYNWNKTKTVLEFMEYIGLKPLILLEQGELTKDEYIEAFKSYVGYFLDNDIIDFYNIQYQFSKNFSKDLKEAVINILQEHDLGYFHCEYSGNHLKIDKVYDTAYMIPYLIHKAINDNSAFDFIRAFDVLEKEVILTNEVFFGASGLINDMGIKKPSYYAYYLLSKLGNILIEKGNGYIITKSKDEYQILIYNYEEEFDSLISFEVLERRREIKNTYEKKFSLNIINTNNDSQITTYTINEEIGSSYNYWLEMGKPIRLNKQQREILYKATFPSISFKYVSKSMVLNILPKLKGYGAQLILIKKVPKSL